METIAGVRFLSGQACKHSYCCVQVETAGERFALRNARVRDMSGICRYIDTRAENGMTALHMAALSGTLACVQMLLEAGASMMVRTVYQAKGAFASLGVGSTPLHAAAFRGDLGIVQAMLQAHADALGRWNSGAAAAAGQREWENDGRVDLRSVTSTSRQLPYHLARQHQHRHLLRILNPTVAIDAALEDCRENESGFGPQKLSTLASYALRQGLLNFLHGIQASRADAAVEAALADQAQALERAGQLVPGLPGGNSNRIGGPVNTANQPQAAAAAGKVPSSINVTASSAQAAASAAASPVPPQPCIMPAARGRNPVPASPPSPGPIAASAHRFLPRRRSSASILVSGGSASSSMNASRDASPLLPQLNVFAQHSGVAARKRHAHFAATVPARFAGFAHGQHQGGRPLSAGQPWSATGSYSRQRRSSPGHLEDRPQSAPVDPAASPNAGGGGALHAATAPLPRRLRTGSAGLTLERPLSGIAEGRHHSVTGRGGWRLFGRQDAANDDASSTASSSDFSFGAAAAAQQQHRPPCSRGILHTFSNLARRIVSAEAGAGGKASIAGFEERPVEPSECGICLDALEEVAINGCCHKLCVECALSLCEIHKKPPLCPFCRLKIQGFHVAGTAK